MHSSCLPSTANFVRTSPISMHQKGLVLQYQLHNRVENLADVSTRCSGLLQGEESVVSSPSSLLIFTLKKTRVSGRNVGKVFNPVVKLVLENQPFLMPEPAEKPSLQSLCSNGILTRCYSRRRNARKCTWRKIGHTADSLSTPRQFRLTEHDLNHTG